MSPRLSIFPALLAAFAAGPLRAQAPQPNDKAARVLEPLLKRPGSGPLFERFVNAWLDTSTLDELGKFLAQRVAAEPSTPHRLLLALFHARQGEPVKALEQFRAALDSDPGSADIWYQKALLESRTLDFEAAIASLGKCLALKPTGELPLQAAQLLGRLEARAGRTEAALQTWRALMASRPADEELREDILELQIAESLWPAAQETAAALVAQTADPYRRVLRRMRLGDVLDRAGQREKALDTFAACLADTGAGSWLEKEILSQIEKLFRREDDLSGLRAHFTKLLEAHAHRAGLQRAQARLLLEAGETEAAIACGRALMALSPGDRAVREEFIALLTGAGRAGEAIPQVEQLLAQAPDDLELRLTLADLKHAAKDTPGALAALRDYEQRAAGKDGTALRIAGLMDRYGLTDEAVKTLRAALERADQPEARQMLASLLHKSDKKEAALAEWQRLAAGGSLPMVQQTARAMQAHGETDAAWQLMQAAAPKAESDAVFLTQLCTLADVPERAVAALPSARRLVELARSAPDLNNALDVAQRVVRLSGKTDEFIAELTQSAATAQALCFLATLREAGRDTIGANEALDKARAVSPELALAQLVRLWSMRGDFTQAAAAAEQLFNGPNGRQGHVAEMLASLQQRAGNAEAALRWTQEWRKLVPGAVTPVLSEARLLESLGREPEALAALRSAAGRFEGNEDIRARLASLSLDTGRTAEALRLYSTLYEEAADLSAKMRWLGEWGAAAEDAGQLENLIAQFEDRRRENRGSVAPLMALAELHRIADNYDARRNALTEAARLKPDDPEIALEIARLEARESDEEAAIRTLRPMLAKDSSGRVAALLADLLINSGQLDEGLKLLTESTAASPGAVELAAVALARRDEEKTALTFLQPHLAKYPDDWRLHYLAAVIEWRTGDHEAAAARLLPLASASTPLARAGSALTASGGGQSYDEMVLRIMPPDVQRFFRLLLASSAIMPSTFSQWGGYSRQSPYASLPASFEEVQDRSAALVMQLAKSAAPEKHAEWTAELERRGFASARLMGDLPPLRRLQPSNRSFDFSPLLREYPDSRPLLALAALATGYRQWTTPADAARAEQAWAAFKTDALPAAIFLALPGGGHSDPRAAWETEVLTAAEKMDTAPALLTLAAVRSAELVRDDDPPDIPQTAPLREDWRKRVIAVLERWRSADAGAARGYAESLRAQAFRGLAQEYARTKAAAPLAALLDAEWRTQSSRPQSPPYVSSDEPLARPLGFPPWFLPGLPETLRDVMQRYLTSEAAALAAPLVQEPLLRVLLASKAPGEAAAQPPPDKATTAVPFILAASWAEKRGDFAAAAEQAVKALYLPVSQEARRRLDGALAYWASKKGKPGDALHTAGREAALRLRRDAVSDERRAELATLMDRLGLVAEADRLMRQGKAAQATATPDERLERLLDDAKNKEALPLLVSEIRGWARQKLNTGGEPSREVLAQWRTRVQANGLLPQVMQSLLPAQPTPQQCAEIAATCELTGDPPRAREYYERALAGGVRKEVPHLLLSSIVSEDQDRALALLKEFPDLWKVESVQRWMHGLLTDEDRTMTVNELIAFAQFFERAAAVMPESAADGFPTAAVLETACNDARAGDFYTVTEVEEGNLLGARYDAPPAVETERVKSLAAERLAACERLARRLMAIRGCGLEAWSYLGHCHKAQKKEPAELLSDGMAMVARELSVAPAGRRLGSGDANVLLDGIVFQLMQTASKAGRTADFAKEVVAPVRSRFSPSVADRMLEAWPLYEAAPEQFAASAREFIKKRGAKSWSTVIVAADLRKLGAELAPDLLAYYSKPDPKSADHSDFYFGVWCNVLEQAQGRAAVEKFFLDVMNALLGPAAEREAFFKDAKSVRLESAMRIMGNLATQEAWTGFVMRYLRAEFIPYATEEVEDAMTDDHFSEQTVSITLFRLHKEEQAAAEKAFLDSLTLTEDLATFYGVSGEVISHAARTLDELPMERRIALGVGGDPARLTFGQLVLSSVADGLGNGLWHALAGWEERIAALPEPQGSLVLDQLRGIEGALASDATPGARAFYAWLHKDRLADAKLLLAGGVVKFLKEAAEGKFESDEALVERCGTLLRQMAEESHPRGREMLAAARRALTENRPESGSLLLDMLTENLGDYREARSGETTAYVIGLIAAALRDGEPAAAAYERSLGNFGQSLLNSEDTSVEGRLTACLERLAPVLQPGEARLLMVWALEDLPSIYNWRNSRQRYAEGVRWAESLRGKCPHEELRLEMEMALRFHYAAWDEAEPFGVTDEAALPVEQRHYLALLRDEALPAPLRLAIGTTLLDNDGDASEPPLVRQVARQLHEALTAGQGVTPAEEARVFLALAELPETARDAALAKSLLPLTTLPRLRENLNDYNIAGGMVALLDLALHAGDTATADRLLEMEGKFPGQGALAMLARHGQKQRLADLLKKRPAVLQNNDDTYSLGRWDAALQSSLPGALEAIADPVQRYETLTLLTLRSDPDPLPPGLQPRTARTAELAAAFSAVPWRGTAVRDRVLARFISWYEAVPEALLPAIEESAARVPLAAVPHMDENRYDYWTGFSAALISRAFVAGDAAPLLAAMQSLQHTPRTARNSLSGITSTLTQIPRGEVLRRWQGMTPEVRGRVCAASLRFVPEFKTLSGGSGWTEQLFSALMLHALAGRMEDLNVWHSALPETERAVMRNNMEGQTPEELLRYTSTALTEMPGTPEEHRARRLAIFTALALNPLGSGPGVQFDADFLGLKGATPEEFLKLETPLTAARPDDGWLAASFARVHAAAGAWDHVLARTTAALAQVKPERGSAYAPLLELRTQAMEHTGRGAEMLAEISALATLPVSKTYGEARDLSSAAQARLLRRLAAGVPPR